MSPKKYLDRLSDAYVRFFSEKPKLNVWSPLEKGDHPELDSTELLDQEGVSQYQSIIGSLQWAISLGRFDIATAVMSLSSYRSTPRQGHLDRAKRIVCYLLRFPNGTVRFRTGLPDYSDLPTSESLDLNSSQSFFDSVKIRDLNRNRDWPDFGLRDSPEISLG